MGPGSHVGFPISAKNKNLVYDHPMNNICQVWLKSIQRFQRRFKCEKLTDGQTEDGRLPMTKAHMAYGQVS
jgi:hypothetical protein